MLGIGFSIINSSIDISGNIFVKEYDRTFYNVLKKEAESNGPVRIFSGNHQDALDSSLSTETIYYWYSTDTSGIQSIKQKKQCNVG